MAKKRRSVLSRSPIYIYRCPDSNCGYEEKSKQPNCIIFCGECYKQIMIRKDKWRSYMFEDFSEKGKRRKRRSKVTIRDYVLHDSTSKKKLKKQAKNGTSDRTIIQRKKKDSGRVVIKRSNKKRVVVQRKVSSRTVIKRRGK